MTNSKLPASNTRDLLTSAIAMLTRPNVHLEMTSATSCWAGEHMHFNLEFQLVIAVWQTHLRQVAHIFGK